MSTPIWFGGKALPILAMCLLFPACTKPAVRAQGADSPCVSPSLTLPPAPPVISAAQRAPRLIRIEGGSFEMGTNDPRYAPQSGPAHRVTVATFYLNETEVTAGQYAGCVAAGVCQAQASVLWDHKLSYHGEDHRLKMDNEACNLGNADRQDHPMNCVDWYQAARFCAWAFERLPSEQEWEYAARGTSGRTYPWGNQAPSPDRANISGEEEQAMYRAADVTGWSYKKGWHDGFLTTSPVRALPAGRTPEGIYALAGNVQEWTSSLDCDYSGAPCTMQQYIVRGEAWVAYDVFPSVNRGGALPMQRESALGFRCAADSNHVAG